VNELATTIPGVATDAVTPTGRLPARGGPRSVFPVSQRSFSPSAVFPAVIPHFCCRAVMDWPRATFLLTMTLHSPGIRRRERTAHRQFFWFPRLASLRNSGRKLEQRKRGVGGVAVFLSTLLWNSLASRGLFGVS
jgi:hypothetical protein